MFGLFKSKKLAPGMVGESARVIALLEEIKSQATVLALRIAGSEIWHNSAVVALDPRHGLMALVRIQDEQGHQRIIRVRRFHAMARCNGVVSFNAELPDTTKPEQTRYVVRIPKTIEYQERRLGGVALTVGAAAVTVVGKGCMVRGRLSDISLTGLEFRTRDMVPFRPNEEASSCTFQLPGGVSISCRIKILTSQLDTMTHETRVRGEMLELTEHHHRELDRSIARLAQEQQESRQETRR